MSGYIHRLHFKTVGNITQTNSLATSLSVSVHPGTMGWLCSVIGNISGHIKVYFKKIRSITLVSDSLLFVRPTGNQFYLLYLLFIS